MVGELAGDQWNEGDVSCSVVRRVALPDAFFAADGLFQTFLTVLDEFGAFPAVIQRELDRYLPFLATTKVLMAAVRNGVGRETAHEAIKEAAVGVALDMRQGQAENDVFARLAADERLGLTADQLASLVADPITFTGAAVDQVQAVVRRVAEVADAAPGGGGVRAGRDPVRLLNRSVPRGSGAYRAKYREVSVSFAWSAGRGRPSPSPARAPRTTVSRAVRSPASAEVASATTW